MVICLKLYVYNNKNKHFKRNIYIVSSNLEITLIKLAKFLQVKLHIHGPIFHEKTVSNFYDF